MLLKNARIVDPSTNFDEISDLRIENTIVKDISRYLDPYGDEEVYDYTGLTITPGLVDIHCHLREPGFTEKETIETGIDSAINGGYTAICPMANTKPAVDNLEILKFVINKAKEAKDIGFYPICALTNNLEGENLVNIIELSRNGAVAFSDDGKPVEDMRLLSVALKYVKTVDSLIMSHSEDSSLADGGVITSGFISGKLGLRGIPIIAESVAVARELEVVRYLGGRYHFSHISSERSIELIRQAKKEGLKVTCETAPHYFSFIQEDMVPYDARFKVNPPIRNRFDLKAVVEGLQDGTIDVIATDHAPHTISEKNVPIQVAPMGICGFETCLGLTLTNLVHNNKLDLNKAIEKLTIAPAKLLNLKDQGRVQVGRPANLTVIDLDREWIVDSSQFKSKCKVSPFDGKKLKGKAVATIINGKINIL